MNKPQLVPLSLPGHFAHELPPDGFLPLKASDEDLHRYGILHRPDPSVSPELARLWRRVMSRVTRFVQPELEVNPERHHVPARQPRAKSAKTGTAASVFTSGNWSGIVSLDQSPYNAVFGTWTVPRVQPPNGFFGDFSSAAWVGLGGWTGDSNLLQAGTEQDVQGGIAFYYAWWEWLTSESKPPEVKISNFPILPGETVAFSVGAYGDGSGRGYFTCANLETGLAIPLTVLPKPDDSIAAPSTISAEWIVERPLLSSGKLSQLADYGEMCITNAAATTISADPKATTFAASSDGGAINVTMLDDDAEATSEEAITPALHYSFL
jgi:hypothetical protein